MALRQLKNEKSDVKSVSFPAFLLFCSLPLRACLRPFLLFSSKSVFSVFPEKCVSQRLASNSRLFSGFLDFSRLFLTFLGFWPADVPSWLYTCPVHPAVHHRTWPHSANGAHVPHRSTCSMYTLGRRAVGLGGFRNQFLRVKTCASSSRLDRRGSKTTCVWQAKQLKRLTSQFYSARLKCQLPEISSFSGPPEAESNGQALEC